MFVSVHHTHTHIFSFCFRCFLFLKKKLPILQDDVMVSHSIPFLHAHTHKCRQTHALQGDMQRRRWQGDFTHNQKQAQNPPGSPHYCFVGGVKFPQGEGSTVIHRTALRIRDFSTVKPFYVCTYFRTYCWRPFHDLAEPVKGHSPLLWTASLSS